MPRLRPNLFGVPFGLAGLAACWSAAGAVVPVPSAVASVLWAVTALVWLVVLVPYAGQVLRERRLGAELTDPTFGPFTAVPVMLVMLLSGALAAWSRPAGVAVFAVGLVLTVLVGGYLTGQWIISDLQLAQWHPGYFLPTVGGGLIAANVAARLGLDRLAPVMLGYGVVCWLVLGSIILARLFTQPTLPLKLRPTLAIELAPPAVAGNAWFAMHGDLADQVGAMIAGYGLLMLLVQLRLVPVFRQVPFGPGSWAYAFSYLQAVTLTLHWLAAERVPGRVPLTWLAVVVATGGVVLLVAFTARGLVRGTFPPREPVEEPASTARVEVVARA
ncbi:dicarboxylate transporter/tellurite-resistance protein TehA [Microlunatus spumicola]|uniref:Dicarboxylate transporter/tellurite-resistance protein TehA n=1 Tax=Microlunatus spumicola TaxID=81499 RepID=A0ABP6WL15_9ACTN